MLSIIYLFLTALLCSTVHSCLPRRHTDASHVEEQLKILRTRAQSTPAPSGGRTSLTNVRIFDGWRFGEPSTVVIDGDTITFNTGNDKNNNTYQTIIDGEGGFLLPGLIDSHIHLSQFSSLSSTLPRYGVTVAMNMGCTNYTLCSAFRQYSQTAPAAGLAVTSFFTAGIGTIYPNSTHATVFGGMGFVTSPSEAPAFVADVFGSNGNGFESDYMKLISEGTGFDQATHNALVEATHNTWMGKGKGRKTAMTHAQDFASYEVAIRSGTDGIQHVPFDIPVSWDMVARIKAQGQSVTPTLNIGKLVTSADPASGLEGQISPGISLRYEAGVTSVRRLMRAGVPVLVGTDANDEPSVSGVGGFLEGDLVGVSLHRELRYLVEDAGMSEVEALRAATVVPSEVHRELLARRGKIEEGYRADMVLLKPGADPLRDIRATMDIARVWVGGVEHVPEGEEEE